MSGSTTPGEGGLPGNPLHWNKSHLTPAQWEEIRQRRNAGETVFSLALEFGVAASTIYNRLGSQ